MTLMRPCKSGRKCARSSPGPPRSETMPAPRAGVSPAKHVAAAPVIRAGSSQSDINRAVATARAEERARIATVFAASASHGRERVCAELLASPKNFAAAAIAKELAHSTGRHCRSSRRSIAMSTKLPSPGKLRELLRYDPETGLLTWKKRTGKMSDLFNHNFEGKPAGTLRTDGYIAVKVSNVAYPAHRIIWAMVHGEWPECVRHANRIDADNRLLNLRASTRVEINRERVRSPQKA